MPNKPYRLCREHGQKWYEVGNEWARANGISDGTNPEASVTREQLATLLYAAVLGLTRHDHRIAGRVAAAASRMSPRASATPMTVVWLCW